MKKSIIFIGTATLLGLLAGSASASTVYRSYNITTGEHLYTANKYEWSQLPNEGNSWYQDSVTFNAPSKGANVYRLYNPNSGEHLFTMSNFEKNSLVKIGWKYEEVAFHSGGKTPVYRLYNPHAGVGAHLDTANAYEKSVLQKSGWSYEGIAWYAQSQGVAKLPGMNLSQIAKGNYNTLQGTWKNARGSVYVFSKDQVFLDGVNLTWKFKGSGWAGFTPPPKQYIWQGTVIRNGTMQVDTDGCYFLLVPKGIDTSSFEYLPDNSNKSKDRISLLTQNTIEFNDNSYVYYKVN